MTLCELCALQDVNKRCAKSLPPPPKMRCAEFTPGIERFCATPADYANKDQRYQMALFFGLKGKELKRVQTM